MKNQHDQSGFTLLELALSMVLLVLVFGVPVRFMNSVADAQHELDAVTEINARAARAMEQITTRVRGADSSQTSPLASHTGPHSPRLDFFVPTGFTNGTSTVPLTPETIELVAAPSEPVDGLDNDNDGLVDEGRVVWTDAAGTTRVLCEDVPAAAAGEIPGNNVDDNGNGAIDEPGFAVLFGPNRVHVYLTLSRVRDNGELIEATLEQGIALRCR